MQRCFCGEGTFDIDCKHGLLFSKMLCSRGHGYECKDDLVVNARLTLTAKMTCFFANMARTKGDGVPMECKDAFLQKCKDAFVLSTRLTLAAKVECFYAKVLWTGGPGPECKDAFLQKCKNAFVVNARLTLAAKMMCFFCKYGQDERGGDLDGSAKMLFCKSAKMLLS